MLVVVVVMAILMELDALRHRGRRGGSTRASRLLLLLL